MAMPSLNKVFWALPVSACLARIQMPTVCDTAKVALSLEWPVERSACLLCLQLAAQHHVDARLVSIAARLEELKNICIKPQRDGLVRSRHRYLSP